MESMAADEDFEPNQDSSFSEDELLPRHRRRHRSSGVSERSSPPGECTESLRRRRLGPACEQQQLTSICWRPAPVQCLLDKDSLADGLRVLIPMDDQLLYAGHVHTVHSPDM